jgi:hypothetical protein
VGRGGGYRFLAVFFAAFFAVFVAPRFPAIPLGFSSFGIGMLLRARMIRPVGARV